MCFKTKTLNYYLVYFSLICVIVNLQKTCDAEYNIIDVDDILSADFMPGSLLMLESPEESIKVLNNSIKSGRFGVGKPFGNYHEHFENRGNSSVGTGVGSDGSVMGALNTMIFHRNKINEYLCRNFIAEQIIDDMSNHIKKRLGQGDKHKKNTTINPTHRGFSLRENMIEDEGSNQYKSWLTKSTTLEDIYKHYQDVDRREDDDDEDDENQEEEEEEQYDQHIAGYAYAPPRPVPPNHQLPIGPAKLGHSGHSAPGMSYPSSVGYGYGPPPSGHAPVNPWHSGGGHGAVHAVPSSHGYGYSGPPLTHHDFDDHVTVHHTEIHHDAPKYSGGHDSGGKDLSELFEIALTALAYLSFGMFIVHVVMCISYGKEKNESVMIIVQATSTTGTVGSDLGMGIGMGGNGGVNGGSDDGGGEEEEEGGNDGGGEEEEGGDNGSADNGGGGNDGEDDGGDEGGGGNNSDDGGGGVDEDAGADNGGVDGGGIDQGGDGGGDDVGGMGGDFDGANGGGDDGNSEVTGESGTSSEGDQIRFPSITNTFNKRPTWLLQKPPKYLTYTHPHTTKQRPTYYQSLQTQLKRPPTHRKHKKSKKNRKSKTSKKSKKSKKKRFKINLKKSHKTNEITYSDAGLQFIGKHLGSGIGEAAPTGRSVRRRRRRRRRKRLIEERDSPKTEAPTLQNPNLESLNELARHVLISIEAALVAHQDDGACLRRVLCQNNRYSRSLANSNKMWIPIWSLGMSWLSGKLTRDIPRATSMLDMLKASVLGLGKANCEIVYQHCDLRAERDKRRRRRRK